MGIYSIVRPSKLKYRYRGIFRGKWLRLNNKHLCFLSLFLFWFTFCLLSSNPADATPGSWRMASLWCHDWLVTGPWAVFSFHVNPHFRIKISFLNPAFVTFHGKGKWIKRMTKRAAQKKRPDAERMRDKDKKEETERESLGWEKNKNISKKIWFHFSWRIKDW